MEPRSREGSVRTKILALCVCGVLALGACAQMPALSYMDQQSAALNARFGGSNIKVNRQGDDIILQMPDVTFDTGRATIKREYRPLLDDMALILNEYAQTTISVTGHADSTGGAQANYQLSEARARAVSQALQDRGVILSRVNVAGMGESRPVASNDTAEGRQQNRRVEIVLSQF